MPIFPLGLKEESFMDYIYYVIMFSLVILDTFSAIDICR